MTLDELKNSDKTFVTCKDISSTIGANAYAIHLMAMDETKRATLGFPVTIIGKRVRIPRIPFLQYIGQVDHDDGDA